MDTAQLAIVALSMLAFTALMLFGPAYIYYRGSQRKSPVPDVVERIANPPAKPIPPVPPIPPRIKCPLCRKGPNWKASDDLSVWTCQEEDCGDTIPGPNAKIRA